ncbi:MAG: nucleotide exchange factor GrpE [Pseudomonadota bacterium]|nr:nucleotide exchange factor GrpE [Pseudomonadota bacterium]
MEEKKADEEKIQENSNPELDKIKSDYLYLQAEFDNYRKQVMKERSQLLKYGSERVLVEVLNVLDNFQRALATGQSASLDSLQKGMELISVQLKTVLEHFGISEVPSEGQKFDPMAHEALSSEESDAVPAGHILRVFRKAYNLHDKLIRPAQVVVAKEKTVK